MLYAVAVRTTLIFVLVLAVPRTARASRLARLLRRRKPGPKRWIAIRNPVGDPVWLRQPDDAPWQARGAARAMGTTNPVPPAESPALTVLLSGQPDGRR